MENLELEGKWNRVKGAVKQKYGEWFDDDKVFAEGKWDEIVGKIQEKSGRTKEDLEKEISEWKEDNEVR
ncbi:CsbD family protein [Faecalibacter rhinopitheci]|uniref:CsbD family protein n=1 Tax=Faecalibacter rhinopitheci TaxID=2779678 RepID=A0A8J7FQ94_9FLAO|nr:CsbD family protein [Faecalibacter rhinopitheci]MBF0597615.1 CsbD family protein [Faecalibacter rhinopitheci]